jgi:hypothetical protein
MLPVPPNPEGIQSRQPDPVTEDTEAVEPDPEWVREKRFGAMASREVADSHAVQATWGKALSLAAGDEVKAKVLYVELRVVELEREYHKSIANVLSESWTEIVTGKAFLCPYCETRTTAGCTRHDIFGRIRLYYCDSCGANLQSAAQAQGGAAGLSRPLLICGGLAGFIVAFLPLLTVSILMGGMGANHSVMIAADWRGKICLAGYVAALVLALVLYPPNGLRQKALAWIGVGVGLLVVVMALWLLVLALDSGSTELFGMGRAQATVGVGAFLNVVAGAAVAAAGFLKARDEKLL